MPRFPCLLQVYVREPQTLLQSLFLCAANASLVIITFSAALPSPAAFYSVLWVFSATPRTSWSANLLSCRLHEGPQPARSDPQQATRPVSSPLKAIEAAQSEVQPCSSTHERVARHCPITKATQRIRKRWSPQQVPPSHPEPKATVHPCTMRALTQDSVSFGYKVLVFARLCPLARDMCSSFS